MIVFLLLGSKTKFHKENPLCVATIIKVGLKKKTKYWGNFSQDWLRQYIDDYKVKWLFQTCGSCSKEKIGFPEEFIKFNQ